MTAPQSLASQVILGIVLSLTSIGVGYQLGALSSRDKPTSNPPPSINGHDGLLVEEEEENDDDDVEGIPDGDLAAVSAGFLEPCKLVLVVRTDLKLPSGDIASQCSQATLACYKALVKKNRSLVQHWERTGQAKIALKAKSEDQLQELEAIAKSLNLCARSIKAHGLAGVTEGAPTILAIGPAPVNLVNEVTGKLRLL